MGYIVLKICAYGRKCFGEVSWTKYVYTCCLWYTSLTSGMVVKQLGSALPEIQQRTHVQFSEASSYIAVLCIASLFGCVMAGLMYGRVPPTCYLCLVCTGLAVSETVLPWCDSAAKAYVVHFVIGISYVGIIVTVTAELCALWGNNVAVVMLINSLLYSVGGILSSVITAPFLSTSLKGTNKTIAKTDMRLPLPYKLRIPFTISAIFTTIAAVSQLVLFCIASRSIIKIQYLDFDVRSGGKKLQHVQRILIIVLTGLSMLMIGDLTAASFFLPYFLLEQVRLPMSNAAYTLSFYATSRVFGRFSGFILVKQLSNYRLLLGHSIIYILSLIGLWNYVKYSVSVSLIFMTGAGLGFGISVLVPSMNSYVEETCMPVTGSFAGFLFASCMFGEILTSSSIGYLSENVSSLMFIYATLSEIVLFVFFILMTKWILN